MLTKRTKLTLSLLLSMMLFSSLTVVNAQVVAEKGLEFDIFFIPKFLGILPFQQTDEGAQEAHAELENPGNYQMVGTDSADIEGQIAFITSLTTQGVDVISISANDFDALVPSTQAAAAAGITITTWDSPINPAGEVLFVPQVDFGLMGVTMADMALQILGADGGQMAVLSATPDASNQNQWIASMVAALESDPKYANIELVSTVYGNDDSEDSYNEALGLVDSFPDLGLIMAPTSVGAPAAAKAVQDEGLCDQVKVSGLAAPEEMLAFIQDGCAPAIAWWSFVDLGYLTYYVNYLLANGQLNGDIGESFIAGRLGEYTIEADPNRDGGKMVLLGDFTIYTIDNAE